MRFSYGIASHRSRAHLTKLGQIIKMSVIPDAGLPLEGRPSRRRQGIEE